MHIFCWTFALFCPCVSEVMCSTLYEEAFAVFFCRKGQTKNLASFGVFLLINTLTFNIRGGFKSSRSRYKRTTLTSVQERSRQIRVEERFAFPATPLSLTVTLTGLVSLSMVQPFQTYSPQLRGYPSYSQCLLPAYDYLNVKTVISTLMTIEHIHISLIVLLPLLPHEEMPYKTKKENQWRQESGCQLLRSRQKFKVMPADKRGPWIDVIEHVRCITPLFYYLMIEGK